ncbi:MAG: membrane dipeptidase [Victivallaceae bacterium]|nr:membrane dipeptidase [Victivallaceae bacterium]
MARSFEECRKIGLEILKPSDSELQHGHELHQQSLVWDAYGFAPTGRGPYPKKLREIIAAGAGRDEITDTIEEFNMVGSLESPAILGQVAEAWERAGVDCVFQNAGVEGNSIERLIKRLSRFTYVADRHNELYSRVAFPEQVVAAKANGKRCLYLTTNGVPVPRDIESVESALDMLKVFFRLGVRMMHMTYNRRNLIGDGCAETSNAGLSDFGREVVWEMNRVGIIPDVAHSGQRTSLETAQCSKKPVVASHSVAGKLSSHYRAKSDETIKAIIKSGGYIGICAHPPFYRGSGYIDSFLDHIDYVAKNYGADYVAIGTDHSNQVGTPNPEPLVISARRPIFEQYWSEPDAPFTQDVDEHGSKMYDSVAWTNWPLFTVGLVQRGYSDNDIQKIIGGNVKRVAEETLEA